MEKISKVMIGPWPRDYKWYEYCPHCKKPAFIGDLPDEFGKCECGETMRYCSKDVLPELENR